MCCDYELPLKKEREKKIIQRTAPKSAEEDPIAA